MKSERPPTGSVQPLVAAAPGHAAESSAGPAAPPLPPRTDAGTAASERDSGSWEHLAPLVELRNALIRRMHEAADDWYRTNESHHWSRARAYERAFRPLRELEDALRDCKDEEARGGNDGSSATRGGGR